ncbi:MAG: ATP-dependent metallopeptidase FtsH/Yme1/Tma family protein [Synechococcales cyanobacterium T60_A2020_003]|nr:ATP-dependent metallopeptidase FtsH/Yme1/Tma family protein [Synechococcales cyanobacterium T60_A2020_003]
MPRQPERQSSSADTNNSRSAILAWLAIFLLLNFLLYRLSSNSYTPYSQFLDQVEAGKVERAVISPNHIEYELTVDPSASETGKVYTTTPVANDPDLLPLLRSHNVELYLVTAIRIVNENG